MVEGYIYGVSFWVFSGKLSGSNRVVFRACCQLFRDYTHQKKLATLDGEIVDPEITVKLEMRDVLKVHDAQR